jgi:hypothetical protein
VSDPAETQPTIEPEDALDGESYIGPPLDPEYLERLSEETD